MPRNLLRLFIVFAAILAVPIQGAAAASAGLCMALGGSGHAAPAVHGHAGDPHIDDGNAPAHHHEGGGKDSRDAHCPPCVSCCAAATIAPFPPVFIPDQPGGWIVASLSAAFSGVAPDQLDRPPLAL